MNLFLIVWNPSENDLDLALSKIHDMKEVFTSLDVETLWSFNYDRKVFVSSISTKQNLAKPRTYVRRTEDEIVLYDGCMVNQSGHFRAHNAEELATHWDNVTNALEGQYVVSRIQTHPVQLEIINDPLGVYQTYYLRQGSKWFISNSPYLLRCVGQTRALDTLGIRLYLCWGWAGSDRTLHDGIRVIPGGQHWVWQQNSSEPIRKTYFHRQHLALKYQSRASKGENRHLASELVQLCKHLPQESTPISCPLTAGRDSRLLAAILLKGNIVAQYFCRGILESESIDIQISTQIAQHFNLPFQIENISETNEIDSLGTWAKDSRRWILEKDGLASLGHFISKGSLQTKEPSLGVTLSGCGGEIGRGYYSTARFFLHKKEVGYVHQHLIQKLMWRRANLVQSDAINLAKSYLHEFIESALDEGFSLVEIPDLLYTYERVHRWAGNNISLSEDRDLFAPLCTRPFVKAAFSISPQQRYTEPMHYNLLKYLEPKLHTFPFEKPWRPQNSWLNCLHEELQNRFRSRRRSKIRTNQKKPVDSGLESAQRLSSRISFLRDLCLSQPNSALWNFINRSAFERLISKDLTTRKNMQFTNVLWDAATLFLLS